MSAKHAARRGSLTLALAGALLATGCAVLEGDKIDYKSASRGASLDVPPDLTQLSKAPQYAVPGSPVTASGQAGARTGAGGTVALASAGDVRVERAGSQRWLVISRPPEQLWNPIRDFWQENGFLLAIDQQDVGILETDWAENRAKIPQDIIRSTIGRVLDSLYDTGQRDKFRTRLERLPNGSTEVYISHRGMEEVYRNNQTREQTVWQPRPADPELEAEFLRRLMVKLGVAQEQARSLTDSGALRPTSRVASAEGVPVVVIDEGFDRAWRRVGLALDRTGFTVEDRDRAQGVYFVRYVEPTADRKEPGLFARLFSSGNQAAAPLKLRIALRSQGESTTVSVLNASGAPESSANAQRIVKVIADDLR